MVISKANAVDWIPLTNTRHQRILSNVRFFTGASAARPQNVLLPYGAGETGECSHCSLTTFVCLPLVAENGSDFIFSTRSRTTRTVSASVDSRWASCCVRYSSGLSLKKGFCHRFYVCSQLRHTAANVYLRVVQRRLACYLSEIYFFLFNLTAKLYFQGNRIRLFKITSVLFYTKNLV